MLNIDPEVASLIRQGLFKNALSQLERISRSTVGRPQIDVAVADLNERLGQHQVAKSLAEKILRSKTLSANYRAAAEYTLARVLSDQGQSKEAIRRYQRAASLAEESNDSERLCWSKLRLLNILDEQTTPGSTTALLGEVRSLAARTGNPQTAAAVHLYAGETEAKRGLLKNAERHTRVAQSLLATMPNLWLNAIAENTLLAISIMAHDFDEGARHGSKALEYAEESGAAATIRACLGNLGNLSFIVGDLDRAIALFERAIAILPSNGPGVTATLDSIAKIHLAQGRLQDCETVLARIDECAQSDNERLLYPNRYAQLTKTQLAIRRRRWDEALDAVAVAHDLAGRTNDLILKTTAILTKADILQQVGQFTESLSLLNVVAELMIDQPPELSSYYERLLGNALLGDTAAATQHFLRAQRICEVAHGSMGLLETGPSSVNVLDQHVVHDAPDSYGQFAIQCIATIIRHRGRPDIQTRELIHLLKATECAEWIEAHPARQVSSSSQNQNPQHYREYSVNKGKDAVSTIVLRPKADVKSHATLNAFGLVIGALQELESYRDEREERERLWPSEEVPLAPDGTVVVGQMNELLDQARQMAGTNVTVLITGESGTGKEILARKLHSCSTRSRKAWVPFNCASIPREMLESQLFGHRRGAFTGADRDQLGVIRSASGGTLFLDEIGELSLDLQPKLLRFLESGEVSPLGDPGPLTVDVRVVAATNARLESLVRDGKFREDLYYRLNVFRLKISPLRERRDEIPALVNAFVTRAAAEFQKGHVTVAEDTMEHLILYPWPGNVRQLLNEIRRMVALAEPNAILRPKHISTDIRATLPPFPKPNATTRNIEVPLRSTLSTTLSRIETEMIKTALRDHGGRVDAAAKALGISRKGLYLKRQRLGL